MSDFTASNGIAVANHGGNWDRTTIQFEGEVLGLPPDGTYRRSVTFNDRDFEALREFFQKENDDRLGRWRWPENPDYVVYLRVNAGIRVVSESSGDSLLANREAASKWKAGEPTFFGAARAFFDAHPEPKPWHDAKPDEGWLLTIDGDERVAVRGGVEDFIHVKGATPWSSPTITAGRRIWPEDKEVEK